MTTPQPTAEQLIAAIREREQKATPGPWFHWLATTEFIGWTVQVAAGWLFKQSDKCGEHDAEFIANARQDIPLLLEALSALQQQMAEQQQALTAAQADVTIHLQRRQALEQQVAALTQERNEAKRSRAADPPDAVQRQDLRGNPNENAPSGPISRQAVAYMAGSMAMTEPETDQEQNWTFGHLVTFGLAITDDLRQRLETVEQELSQERERASRLEDAAFHFQTCRRCRADGEFGRSTCLDGQAFSAFLRGDDAAVLAEGPAPAAKEGKADGD